MRPLALVLVLVFCAALPAAAQFANPDTLYDAGSLSFSYVQTPFPNYSGAFAAEGEGLLPDGTLPPGATESVGGGSGVTVADTVATAIYGVIDNGNGTYDLALVALQTLGPLTAGSYPVDPTGGTAIFGFIDDAVSIDLPDTLDAEHVLAWLQDLPAAHKLVSTTGAIQIAEVSADTLRGTFSGTTIDIDNVFFIVNFSGGQFDLSGADISTAVPATPVATAPLVRAWPNPFNPRTSVVFALTAEQQVEVAVHDLAGRRVRTLHRGRLGAGDQRLQWNGADARGERLAAGVYLVQVRGEGWRSSAKVTLAP